MMLLAVDIGNSATKFGLFEGQTLTSKFFIPTRRNTNATELALKVGERLSSDIDSAIVCSVVPDADEALRSFVNDLIGTEPIFVNNAFDFGLKIKYEPLESLGTDRLVAAYAGAEKHGAPCIVCGLGTATTIDVVSSDRELLGGVIAPGLDAMADSLHARAPRLPRIELDKPKKTIGNSTIDSITSGIYNGYVAMVEGLVNKITCEYGEASKIATGGNAKMVEHVVDFVEPDLILQGLRELAR